MMDRRTVLKAAAGIVAGSMAGTAFADEKFPARGMRIVVPYPPGGVTDIVARVVSETLSKKYGQSVIVENKPGGNALIAQQIVANAKPDGYTLMTGGLGSQVLPPATIRNLPLDVPNRFIPIAQVAEFVNVMVVKANSSITSVADFIRHAKSASQEVTYGTNGIGSSSHLTSEYFAMRAGIKMLHIPYKGSSDAQIDVANGLVDVCFANLPAVLPLVKQGKLKVLAVTSTSRARQFPDAPTMAEAGISDFNVTSWLGIYGPAGMPKDIVDQLSRDIVEGVKQADNRARLEGAGFQLAPLHAAEWDRHNKAELARWSEIAKKAGIVSDFGKS
jgi:tripartite-type tricarboxylate transporter receptor subunit TctC